VSAENHCEAESLGVDAIGLGGVNHDAQMICGDYECVAVQRDVPDVAILYYAHELQRRSPAGISISVFEPGFMPGTGLSRGHGPGLQKVGRVIERIPGVSSPARSGPALASVILDDRWAHLSGGAFVVKNNERAVKPFASDPARELRLWQATAELFAVER
jgi:hypothetical protein